MCKWLCFTVVVGLGIKGGKEGKTSTRVKAWVGVAAVGTLMGVIFALVTYFLHVEDPDGWLQWFSALSAAFFLCAGIVGVIAIPVVLYIGKKKQDTDSDHEKLLNESDERDHSAVSKDDDAFLV